jgi:GTPase
MNLYLDQEIGGLDEEIEEGNIEYKRCLTNIDNNRREEFISQMMWRIKEGRGEAIYYLGVENNGTFYNWSKNEIKQSIDEFKKIIKKANLKLIRMTKNYYSIGDKTNYYLKIVVRENKPLLPEKRIFLFGESGVGKTTFLANIICSKIDKEARLYLLNHKHEMIEKKTSSFNYNYIIYDNIKWVFIEAPGDEKYKKTRNKLFLSFGSSIDLCIFIEDGINVWKFKEYYIKLIEKINIPFITLNIHSDTNNFPLYNSKELICKNDFFNNIKSLVKNENNIDVLEFVVLQFFKNPDVGLILTGILKSGIINENKNYFFYIKNNYYKINIKSIHLDGKPINKIIGPKTVSLCIEFKEKTDIIKNYMGIITNKILEKVVIDEELINKKNTLIYKDNKCFTYDNYKNYYQTNDKILIVENFNI